MFWYLTGSTCLKKWAVLAVDQLLALRNTIEFQNRELNTGSFPKGLALLFAANSNWNYDKAQ